MGGAVNGTAPAPRTEASAFGYNGDVSAKPIATYSERLLEVRRELELYEDRVVVRASWFPRRRFENVVPLGGLRSALEEITIRYRVHRYAGGILAIGALGLAALYYRFRDAMGVLGYLALAVAICGAVLLILTYPNRRIRFVRFRTRSGKAGLDIGSAGNDMATFERFVEQVRAQIRRCPPT